MFLEQLENEAVCQKKPEVLKNWGFITKATNPPCRRVYDKKFLEQFENETICQKKPEILKNLGVITKLSSLAQLNSSKVSTIKTNINLNIEET